LDAGIGYYSYSWSNGSTGQWVIADKPDTYWVTVTNSLGCSGSDTINVIERVLPDIGLDDVGYFCIGSELILDAFGQYDQYLWSTGETTPQIHVREEGIYWVNVTTQEGCKNADTISIYYYTVPSFESIDIPSSGKIVVNGNRGEPPYEYALENRNFQASNEFMDLLPGEYLVYIRDINGCENDTTVQLSEFPLKIPNFFTPNGDNIHDTWEIEGIAQFPESIIRIFNRYGKLLLTYSGNEQEWDGTYNNRPLPSDTYWYQINIPDCRVPVSGDVTIKR